MKTFKDLSLGQEAVMVTNKMIAQKVVLCNNHTNKFNATLHVLTFAVDDESCYSIAIDDEVMEHGKYAPYGKPWIVVDDDEIRNVLEEANDNLEKALATNKEILSQVAK